MRIRQIYTSEDLAFFKEKVENKYNLVSYYDRYTPAIFHGCYNKNDIEAISLHKSIAVILWGGSDAMSTNTLEFIKSLPRDRLSPIYHIARSNFIEEDLENADINYLHSRVYSSREDLFTPAPIGKKIYVYSSKPTADRFKYYGVDLIPKLQEYFPNTEFVVQHSSPPTVPFERMPEIYRQCALGLRLVPHDGCSGTVVQLGLMGRKCIWNGDLPNAIPYSNFNDIVKGIKRELEREGEVDSDLSKAVSAAISDRSWLYVSSYRQGAL
jgi:hypothetical protein